MLIAATIGWIFVVIFALLAVIVLLDIAGLRRIPDSGQRKWLFRAMIGSVVPAVIGLGTWYLDTLHRDPPPDATPAPSPTSGDGPGKPVTTPTGAVVPDHPQPEKPVPAEVLAWAGEALGPRPTLAEIDAHPYPACVAELRALSDPPLSDDAIARKRSAHTLCTTSICSISARWWGLSPHPPKPVLPQAPAFPGLGVIGDNRPSWRSDRLSLARHPRLLRAPASGGAADLDAGYTSTKSRPITAGTTEPIIAHGTAEALTGIENAVANPQISQ